MFGLHAGIAGAMMARKFRRSISVVPSIIGGIPNTQEVVNLCAEKGIYPEVSVVPVQDLNQVFTALDSGNDSATRHVLDLASLNEATFGTCSAPPPTLAPNPTKMNISSVLWEIGRMVLFY